MTGYQILHKFLAVTFRPRSSKNFAKVIQAALSSTGTTVTQAFHSLLVPSNWKLVMDFIVLIWLTLHLFVLSLPRNQNTATHLYLRFPALHTAI